MITTIGLTIVFTATVFGWHVGTVIQEGLDRTTAAATA